MTLYHGLNRERRKAMVAVQPIRQFSEPPIEQRELEAVAEHRRFEQVPVSHLIAAEYVILATSVAVVPDQILLGSLRDPRLRVQAPILVKFTKENQHFIAEAVGLDEFGFGSNSSEALADLQRAIAELYFTLERELDRLGADLQQVWAKLQEAVIRSQ